MFRKFCSRLGWAASALLLLSAPTAAMAQENSDAELAKKLNNPVSSLISVPLQFNYDCCYGPSEGYRGTLNIQPVVPVSVAKDWNMIVRTIVPVIHQDRTSPEVGSVSGFGDITQSFFFSPKADHNGFVWAVGPVVLWPIGREHLGTKTWGAGPTALALQQTGPWTVGVLANHIWSVADVGGKDRPDVSQTFIQPFLSWTSATHTTVGINTESAYNWETRSWTIPINLQVSQLYNFGGQRVQLTGGAKVYAAREDHGPAWGLRFVATFLFPQ